MGEVTPSWQAAPASPSATGPVAILAGSGELPILLADRLGSAGRPHRVLAFRGFCEGALRARADSVVGLLDVRRIEACLTAWRPSAVTLAGGLNRPSAAALVGAFSAFRNRDDVAAIVARGDDNLLRGAVELLESKGFPLVGVRDLAPELLAEAGCYGARRPTPEDERAVALGLRLLDGISAFDIGQAVVVAGERIVAVEGPEGTDRMLARARSLRGARFFGRRTRGGVLVKAPKRGQDLRVDLPAIGPRTVVNAARAGLDGIAVASGLTLVLNRRETATTADRLGLFVIGLDRDAASAGPAGAAGRG